MKKKKARKIVRFNKALYFILCVVLILIFVKVGWIQPSKQTIGGAVVSILKSLLALELNAVLHECIHYLTGKLVIPDAEFKISIGFNRAQIKRIGGDPTRIQDQIYTIMPFVILSIVAFFIGLAVHDKTDFIMLMVAFNTAGCVSDIEWFFWLFCFPMNMPLSQMNIGMVEHKNWYCKFWAKWNRYFTD